MCSALIEMIWSKDLNLLNNISIAYFVIAVVVFGILTYGIQAPYGRYVRDGWGIYLNGKLGWFIQELPNLVIPIAFLIFGRDAPGFNVMPNMFIFLLFIVHYVHRTCIYPYLLKGDKPLTLMVFVCAIIICTVNGYLQSAYLLYHAEYGPDWLFRPHLWIGTVMFISGMAINIHSDHILRNLRNPGETSYKIPRGGMFNYVSGANFFGEMVEWAGFAIVTWSLPGLAYSFFTCCNIGPRAYQHHQYYIQKFEDYPKDRKAVIPFIL